MSTVDQFEWFMDRAISRPHVPVAFVGNPGTGKTSQIEKWAARRELQLVKLLASTLDETDVAGIVVRDGDHAKTLSPQWYLQLKDTPGILFMDELNCCRKEVADTLLTLVCSRHLPNGDKLHDGVLIVAAMNDHEQCDNYELSPAMRTRFMWIKHELPITQWLTWFIGCRETSNEHNTVPAQRTMPEWLSWFQSDAYHDADKKALLRDAVALKLKFDDEQQYVDKQLPTTPRGLFNLAYWTDSATEMIQWARAFVDDEAADILKSVNYTAYTGVANSVFTHRKTVAGNPQEATHLETKKKTLRKIQDAVTNIK